MTAAHVTLVPDVSARPVAHTVERRQSEYGGHTVPASIRVQLTDRPGDSNRFDVLLTNADALLVAAYARDLGQQLLACAEALEMRAYAEQAVSQP